MDTKRRKTRFDEAELIGSPPDQRERYVKGTELQNPYAPVAAATTQKPGATLPSWVIPPTAAFTLTATLNEAGFFWGNVGFTYWWHFAFLPLSALIWMLLAFVAFLLGLTGHFALRTNTSTKPPLSKAALGFAVAPAVMMFLSLKLLGAFLIHETMLLILLLVVLTQTLGFSFAARRLSGRRWIVVVCGMLCSFTGCLAGYLHVLVMVWSY